MKKNKNIKYDDRLGTANRLSRLLWNLVWLLFFYPCPVIFHSWRSFLLGIFGAKIGRGVHVYPSVRIWAPWNLEIGDNSSLGPGVNCYSVDKVTIGDNSTVSQFAYLCTASHDIRHPQFLLVSKPISVGSNAWIAADAFLGPGVKVGDGAVVGARSAVFKDVKPWNVVGGNPAKFLKRRVIRRP